MERKFLWHPDPPSVKDWRAEPIIKAAVRQLPAIPAEVRLAALITAILNQGGLGSCAANAVDQAVHAAQVREGIVDAPYQSRLRLYRLAREILGDPRSDSGTSLRACFDVLRKRGFCPEAAWSYDDGPEKFKLMPPAEAERLSHDQIGEWGYYRIDSTGDRRLEEIRNAIAAGYCVVFGTQVSNKFVEYTADSPPLEAPTAAENILGGHGLTLAEYGPSYLGGPNSWGPGYGADGWFRMSPGYIVDSRSSDFWIVERVPNYSELA